MRDYGLLLWILGRHEEAVTQGRRAIALDPLDATSHLYLCGSLYSLGRLEEAEATCRKGLELSPDGFALRYWLAMILDARGRVEEALAEVLRDKTDWSRLTCLAVLYHRLGRDGESAAALAELKAGSANLSAFQIAQAHAARGEADESFAWLERAYDVRDAGISMTRSCPWFEPVKGDPRWQPFLRKINLADGPPPAEPETREPG
jgi:tetratricopeptide (TPR) repeat protein